MDTERFEAWCDAETRTLRDQLQAAQDKVASLERQLARAKAKIERLKTDAYQQGVEDMRSKVKKAESRAEAEVRYNDFVLSRLQDFVDDHRTGWADVD